MMESESHDVREAMHNCRMKSRRHSIRAPLLIGTLAGIAISASLFLPPQYLLILTGVLYVLSAAAAVVCVAAVVCLVLSGD